MSSSWMNKHVLKFSDAKNKNNESFLLSILIGRYETTGLRSIFTLLSPMWTIHFTLVLIQFFCVACLLVCKYTNQKKVDLCTNSDWSLIYSGKKYCILYCFAHFLIKIQKILDFFLLLFLSSNIAPWVQAEWTNMCLNLVMQKKK